MRSLIFCKLLFASMATFTFLLMPQAAAAQGGPIVVLEYPGYASVSTPGLNQDNPFVHDPDHTVTHRVQPDRPVDTTLK